MSITKLTGEHIQGLARRWVDRAFFAETAAAARAGKVSAETARRAAGYRDVLLLASDVVRRTPEAAPVAAQMVLGARRLHKVAEVNAQVRTIGVEDLVTMGVRAHRGGKPANIEDMVMEAMVEQALARRVRTQGAALDVLAANPGMSAEQSQFLATALANHDRELGSTARWEAVREFMSRSATETSSGDVLKRLLDALADVYQQMPGAGTLHKFMVKKRDRMPVA